MLISILVFCYKLQDAFYTVASIIKRNYKNLKKLVIETGHDLLSNLADITKWLPPHPQHPLMSKQYYEGQCSKTVAIAKDVTFHLRSCWINLDAITQKV